MIIGTGKVCLRAEWCHSLKEKRMVVKSILSKTKNKFNVSISEVEEQDIHNYIVLGFATVSNNNAHAQSTLQSILNFIEENCEAEIVDSFIEIL
jgi:uncharacterized protein YlxP (DUF503 family)